METGRPVGNSGYRASRRIETGRGGWKFLFSGIGCDRGRVLSGSSATGADTAAVRDAGQVSVSLASVLGAPVHTNLVGRAHDTVAELQQNGAATLALAVLAVLVGGCGDVPRSVDVAELVR